MTSANTAGDYPAASSHRRTGYPVLQGRLGSSTMAGILDVYEKRHPKYTLSIEQGTPAVPDDGQYHVIVNEEIILSTRVFDYAKIIYDEKKEELRISAGDPHPHEILRRESAGRDLRALRAGGIAQRFRKDRGGPGGRGGV